MHKITLKDTGGNTVAVCDFPEHAKDVTLSQFIDLDIAYQKVVRVEQNLFANPRPGKSEAARLQIERLIGLANCVAAVCKVSQGDLMKLPAGTLESQLAEFIKSKKSDHEQIEATLYNLFANIFRIVYSYKPQKDFKDEYRFEHSGKVFSIKGSYRDAITGRVRFESMSVAQVVEGLEALRVYEKNQQADVAGNFLFTTMLNVIACTALAAGECFPDEESKIERFLADRIRFFESLPMTTALDVYNFFLSTSPPTKTTPKTDGSGSHQNGRQHKKSWPLTTRARRSMREFLRGLDFGISTSGLRKRGFSMD